MNYSTFHWWQKRQVSLREDAAPDDAADPSQPQPQGPPPAPDQQAPLPDQGQGQMPSAVPPTDVSNDPPAPDMPPQKDKDKDYEGWKSAYLRESVNGDPEKLMDMISEVRDRDGLEPQQTRFIEDNYNVLLLRINPAFEKPSKDLRRSLKDQLDRNNPAVSLVDYMVPLLETAPMLQQALLRINGYGKLKSDLHRKFVAAMIGGVQMGVGGDNADVAYNEKQFAINLSTRFNSEWGNVMIGDWSLKEDDATTYLSKAEVKRLENGSPEEKDVLRRRVVVESIAEAFQTRSFLVNVVAEDGTIHFLGWDLADSLRAAYDKGRIRVKSRISDNSEAMISDDGSIVPLMDLKVMFARPTGKQGPNGYPMLQEIDFLERKKGTLFLTAPLEILQDASMAIQGLSLKQLPFRGNPSDLKTLKRCVYSAHDLIMRQC